MTYYRKILALKVRVLLICCFLAVTHLQSAEGDSEEEKVDAMQTVDLEELGIVANLLAADNVEFEKRSLATTEMFSGVTRAEFGQRANSRAGDIVARLPGAFMGGAPGENKDVRLRGLDKEYSRTQVDGLVLADGGEKRELQLNRIPAELIQEVRVLRNPSPEFESDGLAGRVDIRFRTIPVGELEGELRISAGGREDSDVTRENYSLTLGGRLNQQLGFLGSFNYLKDPTYKLKLENNYSSDGQLVKQVEEDEQKHILSKDFYFDTGYFYERGEIHLKPLYLKTTEYKTKTKSSIELNKPDDKNEKLELEKETKEKLGRGVALSQIHKFDDEQFYIDSRFAWQEVQEDKPGKLKEEYNEKNSEIPETPSKVTLETEDKYDRILSLDTKLTYRAGSDLNHELKAGYSLRYRERARTKTKLEFKPPSTDPKDKTEPKDNYAMDEDYFALFMQDTWSVRDDLKFLYGARYEHVDFSSRTPEQSDVDSTFNDFNPNVQVLWNPTQESAVKFAVSRAINRPKFDEMSPYEKVDKDKVTYGNPNLEPSRSWKTDLSYEISRESFLLSFGAYHQDITGVIETVDTGLIDEGTGFPIFTMLNVGDGWVNGFEMEQRFRFGGGSDGKSNRFTIWSNQTLLRSELVEYSTGIARPFKEQPEFLANLGVDYEYKSLYFTVSARYIGRRLGEDSSESKQQMKYSETIVDAALRYNFTHNISGFLEMNNLTSEDSNEIKQDFDKGTTTLKNEMTGRSFFAGIRYHF